MRKKLLIKPGLQLKHLALTLGVVLIAFIACYAALCTALGAAAARKRGWRRAAGIVAGICGVAAGVFDLFENRAILNLLDVPLRSTTPAMIQAIRGPSTAKWILASVTVVLLAASFIRIPKPHESPNPKSFNNA